MQSSADIHESRCLFTHDKRQKRKRWKDGLLRFHTFNNRLMVYDESSNFVGDMHWRQPTNPVEGDELDFDTFLVQIQEEIRTVTQDLTSLRGAIDQRRKERQQPASHGAVRMRQERIGFERAAETQSSVLCSLSTAKKLNAGQVRIDELSSRPLKAVLAANAARCMGRSTMQQLSPFEVRQNQLLADQKREDAEVEYVQKKRRLEPPKSRVLSSCPAFETSGQPRRPHMAPSLQAATERRRAQSGAIAQSLIEVSSGEPPTRSLEDDVSDVIAVPRSDRFPAARITTVQGTLSKHFSNTASRQGPKLLCGKKSKPIVSKNTHRPLSSDDELDDRQIWDASTLPSAKPVKSKANGSAKQNRKSDDAPASKKGLARKKKRKTLDLDDFDDADFESLATPAAPRAAEQAQKGRPKIEYIDLLGDDDIAPPAPVTSPRRTKPTPPHRTGKGGLGDGHDPLDDYVEADFDLSIPEQPTQPPAVPKPRTVEKRPVARSSTRSTESEFHEPASHTVPPVRAPKKADARHEPQRTKTPTATSNLKAVPAAAPLPYGPAAPHFATPLTSPRQPPPSRMIPQPLVSVSTTVGAAPALRSLQQKAIQPAPPRQIMFGKEPRVPVLDVHEPRKMAIAAPPPPLPLPPPIAVVHEDTGPWSREAYDLFGDWQPPNRRGRFIAKRHDLAAFTK